MDTGAIILKPKDYKSDVQPIWCPGCGHYGIQAALFRALAELGIRPESLVIVSGIGCSSRLPAYSTAYGFHGVHGRALAVATGLKLARPELTVVVVGGDGDGFSIGGNHFLHACRRNVDLTYIVMDNEVYGMTKGQPSPTTAPDWDSLLAPGGTGISPFKPLATALAAGADFVARGYSGDPNGIARILLEAIRHPGFAFVHALSQCVTYRPDQRIWKEKVHGEGGPGDDGRGDDVRDGGGQPPVADFAQAVRRLMTDDGLTTGIFYAGGRAPYRWTIGDGEADAIPAIEKEFAL